MKTNIIPSPNALHTFWGSLLLVGVLLGAFAAPAHAGEAPPPSTDPMTRAIEVLRSDAGRKEKADACRELARIGNKKAVTALANLLTNEELSHMARYGLETIPDSSADKAFRAALGQLHGRLQAGVIGSIGVRRDTGSVKALIRLLQDPDPEVAHAAARALGQIGNAAAAKGLEQVLAQAPGPNLPSLCEGLLRCAELFAAEGRKSAALRIYDHLRTLTVSHQVRTAALRGAILLREEKGYALLLYNLRSDDFALCAAAARISQELPGSELTRLMAGDFPKLKPDSQILLAQTLGKRGDPAALPALLQAARSGDKQVRIAAIRAAAELGTPADVPVFVELLGDKDREVAVAAQEALASLPVKEADTAVLMMFASPNISRRLIAMELASRRRMTNAVNDLFAAARDLEPKVRQQATRTLGELADPAQLPSMLRLLGRAVDPDDLEANEQALGAVCARSPKPDVCVAELTSAYADARPGQQGVLLQLLTTVGGPQALAAVRAAVDNPNQEVHGAAVRAISSWNTPDAAPRVLELLRRGAGPTDTVLYLRGYLRFASSQDLPPEKRFAMCRDVATYIQTDEQKRLLLGALSSIPLPESIDLIQPYLAEGNCKSEACTALVAVAEKLLQGPNAVKLAPTLAEQLERVATVTTNADLAKRARALAEQARAKAAK
jgi:HEAT repeat protein